MPFIFSSSSWPPTSKINKLCIYLHFSSRMNPTIYWIHSYKQLQGNNQTHFWFTIKLVYLMKLQLHLNKYAWDSLVNRNKSMYNSEIDVKTMIRNLGTKLMCSCYLQKIHNTNNRPNREATMNKSIMDKHICHPKNNNSKPLKNFSKCMVNFDNSVTNIVLLKVTLT